MNFIKTLLTETLQNIPALQFKEFDPNQIVKLIVNSIVTLIALAGMILGGWTLWQGISKDAPSDKTQGIVILLGSFSIGALILAIVNLMLK